MKKIVDFNFHDLFSIRLLEPAQEAVQAVKNQIGIQPSTTDSQPDLTVQYQDQGRTPMHHIVMGKTGFADEAFYLMTGQGRNKLRVQFPFESLGQPCTMVCEPGVHEIPLLNLIINMRMLAKGLMPIHASAFMFNEIGVVVNGWPHGGKTSTLFSFLAHGAKFVSDDWLFVDQDRKIYGLMQPVKLADWQLAQLPDFQKKVQPKKQWMIRGLRWFDSMEQLVPERARSHTTAGKTFYRGVQFLNKSQRHVTLSPWKLFDRTTDAPTGRLDVMFLTLSHESSDITVRPIGEEDALERLLAALHYEWVQWEEYYIQYLYAFPNKPNPLMATAQDVQRQLLRSILSGRQMFLVNHPHPVKLDELYRALNETLLQVKSREPIDDQVPAVE